MNPNQSESLSTVTHFSSENFNNIMNIFIPVLVDCLRVSNDEEVQSEVASALASISSGSSEHSNQLFAAGVIPLLLPLLSSQSLNVSVQAVSALHNIVANGTNFRERVAQEGVLDSLLEIIAPVVPLPFARTTAWVIFTLCLKEDPPPPTATLLEVLGVVDLLIHQTDTKIIVDIVWAIGMITNGGKDNIQMIIESGVIPKLVSLLGHTEYKVQKPALRALGNIVAVSDEQTQVVLDNDALSYIPELLKHTKERIRSEAVWFLANVIAGTQSQVQQVIDVGLLPNIIEKLSDSDFRTQKEAAWAIFYLTIYGNKDQVLTLIIVGVIGPFCNLLECQDLNTIHVVLSGLLNMLEVGAESHIQDVAHLIENCNGLQKIEHLQAHGNIEICNLAHAIIEYFFSQISV